MHMIVSTAKVLRIADRLLIIAERFRLNRWKSHVVAVWNQKHAKLGSRPLLSLSKSQSREILEYKISIYERKTLYRSEDHYPMEVG